MIKKRVCVAAMVGRLENKNNVAILTKFPTTASITGNISTVTEPDVSLTMLTAALTQVEIGLPATPKQNLNVGLDNML